MSLNTSDDTVQAKMLNHGDGAGIKVACSAQKRHRWAIVGLVWFRPSPGIEPRGVIAWPWVGDSFSAFPSRRSGCLGWRLSGRCFRLSSSWIDKTKME